MHYSELSGVLFDVDDTLLNNRSAVLESGGEHIRIGMHEISRVAAGHEAGQKWDIPWLASQTYDQAQAAFDTAPAHSLESCLWNTLKLAGVVAGDTVDHGNEIFQFLVRRKNELHEDVLRKHWREVPGAIGFVSLLAERGLDGKMGIASTSERRDVLLFLELSGLKQYFPGDQIVTKEQFVHPKPHPEPFDVGFARLGIPEASRSRVMAFEDDPRGIMSAKAAGLYTAAITTRFSSHELAALEVPPDFIAESYHEFSELLGLSKQ